MIDVSVIEECSRTNVLYLGSVNQSTSGEEVQISLLKMASAGLELLDLYTIEEQMYPFFGNITSMSSYPSSNKQEFLLVGGRGFIIVIKLTKSYRFEEFTSVNIENEGPIFDMRMSNLNIYLATSNSNYIPVVALANNYTTLQKADFTQYEINNKDLLSPNCKPE